MYVGSEAAAPPAAAGAPAQLTPTLAASAAPSAARGSLPLALSAVSRRILSLTPEQRARVRASASAARPAAPSPFRPGTASGPTPAVAEAAQGAAPGDRNMWSMHLGACDDAAGDQTGSHACGGATCSSVATAAARPGAGDEAVTGALGVGEQCATGCSGGHSMPWRDAAPPGLSTPGAVDGAAEGAGLVTPPLWGHGGAVDGGGAAPAAVPTVVHAVAADAAEFGGLDEGDAGADASEWEGGGWGSGWGGEEEQAAGVREAAFWEGEWGPEEGWEGGHDAAVVDGNVDRRHALHAHGGDGYGGVGGEDVDNGFLEQPTGAIGMLGGDCGGMLQHAGAMHGGSAGQAVGVPWHMRHPPAAPAAGAAGRAAGNWDFEEELRWAERQEEDEEECGQEEEPPQDVGPGVGPHSGEDGLCVGQRQWGPEDAGDHGPPGWPEFGAMHHGPTGGAVYGGCGAEFPHAGAGYGGSMHGSAWGSGEQPQPRAWGMGGGTAMRRSDGDAVLPAWAGAGAQDAQQVDGGVHGSGPQDWNEQPAQHEALQGAAGNGSSGLRLAGTDGGHSAQPAVAWPGGAASMSRGVGAAAATAPRTAAGGAIDLTGDAAAVPASGHERCVATAASAVGVVLQNRAAVDRRPSAQGAAGGGRPAGGARGTRELPGVAAAMMRMHDARQTCPDVFRASGPPPGGLGGEGQPWWTALRDFVPVSVLEVRPLLCSQALHRNPSRAAPAACGHDGVRSRYVHAWRHDAPAQRTRPTSPHKSWLCIKAQSWKRAAALLRRREEGPGAVLPVRVVVGASVSASVHTHALCEVCSTCDCGSMQGGRDPRTNEPVYVDYLKQFGEPPAGRGGDSGAVKGARHAGAPAVADGGAVAAAADERGSRKRGRDAGTAAGAVLRPGAESRAAGPLAGGKRSALGARERRLLGDVGGQERASMTAGGSGGRRIDWAGVGRPPLPAGRSTFTRANSTSIHARGDDEGARLRPSLPKVAGWPAS